MSGRPLIHRAEIGAQQDDLDLTLANGDDQPVLRVVQDSASHVWRFPTSEKGLVDVTRLFESRSSVELS